MIGGPVMGPEGKTMDTIIFDIDGTLADVSHRRRHVQGGNKDWGRFFEEMVNDPPLADVCLLAEMLGDHPLVNQGAVKLFVFSGRPDTHRAQTEKWLSVHVRSLFEKAEAILMRAGDDRRPDTEVKRDMLNHIRGQGYDPRLVIDDRPSVIAMWKEEGLTVLEHDSGEWDGVLRTWKPGELHIMVGPSGGGKSTYVETFRWTAPAGAIISSDALREEITGDFRDQSANDQMWATLHAMVKARIEGGLMTVVDATNLHAADRRKLRDLCPSDTSIVYHVIDRPLAEKHKSAGWRDEVVIKGEKLIDKHHKSFQSGLKHILAGDNDPRVIVLDHRNQ